MTAIRLNISILLVSFFIFSLSLSAAFAQDRRWIQVEARPAPGEARERAFAFAAAFPETWGYRLSSGWYGIVLGPYSATDAARRLEGLKLAGMIPPDSYLTDGREFRDQFWPENGTVPPRWEDGAGAPPRSEPVPEVSVLPLPDLLPESLPGGVPGEVSGGDSGGLAVTDPVFADETPGEARASEAALSADERKALQEALAWFGFYSGGIDGAYGAGTRTAMAAWQQAFGLEATGVLTTRQRDTIRASYEAELRDYGFALVEEQESGIDISLPLALVEFDRYEPPFVHFRPKDGSDLSVVLISQPGDQAILSGLYDIIASLDAMPAEGPREKTDRMIALAGRDESRVAQASASLDQGLIKGWMVLGSAANAARDARVSEVLARTFRAVGATALDPGLVPLEEAARRGLVAGLAVQKPLLGRSGFYVSAEGHVLTTTDLLRGCSRITLDHTTEAEVIAVDEGAGLALLRPKSRLAPGAVAEFAASLPGPGTRVALSGYPWEGKLPAPVLTHGQFEEAAGLNGEDGVIRLSLAAREGDAGGPVLDASGAVIGMLLPAGAGAGAAGAGSGAGSAGGQDLPETVSFAAAAAPVAALLQSARLSPAGAASALALPPEHLLQKARDMTVLAACWQ